MAQPGEPFAPFGDPTISERQRCIAMAKTLTWERRADRKVVHRVLDGELRSEEVGVRTLQGWLAAWRDLGLAGLVDGHSLRQTRGFAAIDPRIREIADEVFDALDGDASQVNIKTIAARIHIKARERELGDVSVPEKAFASYLSHRYHQLGATTRAHRTRAITRKSSGHTSFPAMHPSYIAIDATRADVLVFDPLTGEARSVEVLTAISIPTRVIVGLRITARSGNALEAGLLLYDVMRPKSMVVEGTSMDDFRWCGVPEALDLSGVAVHRSEKRIVPVGETLQGVHHKPAVTPTSISCDHGSVFLSDHFFGVCRLFGIDLKVSRGSRPTDNSFIERWHESLQRAWQNVPGYKGRNVSERGRKVGSNPEGLFTAEELERYLWRWVALDYHRSWHEGLIWPDAPQARLTPLEMWDAMQHAFGRLTVPQHPDLIFQFLPIRWLTIRYGGVERQNITYDAPALDEFRDVAAGTFKPGSRKAPFHYDPRDPTRLWFRHPETDRIHEVPWKGRHLLDMPMREWVNTRVLERISERGGNIVLTRDSSWRAIIDQLGDLAKLENHADSRNAAYAARLRFEQAQRDHDEAADFATRWPGRRPRGTSALITAPSSTAAGGLAGFDEVWPDYTGTED